MTSPILAQDSPYGRLYRHPSTSTDNLPTIEESIEKGLLVPSVTNIIGTLDKPFLLGWYAKLAAESAVETEQKHSGLIKAKPDAAIKHFKNAGLRKLEAAGALGNTVHDTVEQLAQGFEVEYPEYVEGYINAFHKFVKEWKPEFIHFEVTCFGSVLDSTLGELKYAGTADFIAKINGLTIIGDWKSGKSIHTDGSLQIAALANAKEMITADGNVIQMPRADSGVLIHLTPKGFHVYQTDPFGTAWDIFGVLRRAWDFHVANLASRNPILMSRPLKNSEKLVIPTLMHSSSLKSGIMGTPEKE